MTNFLLRNFLRLLALSFLCISTTNAAAISPSASTIRKNVISGAAIFTMGDAAAQLYTRKPGEKLFDIERLASTAGIGAVWSGLFVPWLYATAESILPGRTKRRILGKTLITCSFLSTAGNYITMCSRRLMQLARNVEGGPTSVGECIRSCNRDIGHVIRDDLKLWPAYDILCFSFIPPSLRAFTTALMSSSWAMYISIVSSRSIVSSSDVGGVGVKPPVGNATK